MMRKFFTIACMVIFILSSGCKKAAENDKAAVDQNKAGLVRIFNGKDLTGWKATGGAKWTVEDGIIV